MKKNVVVFCTWLEPRRRETYYKVLQKHGYYYNILDKEKVIMKKWSKIS